MELTYLKELHQANEKSDRFESVFFSITFKVAWIFQLAAVQRLRDALGGPETICGGFPIQKNWRVRLQGTAF